jgi:cysteinyl-tRNA synthetase
MKLRIYNTLSKTKEVFEPLNPPFVGMYVCGPTVYGEPHLGHARGAITFDLVYRYLRHLGYEVRYVRNVTDVGHLEDDRDYGEDKISKKARLERLEPMEIVQRYTNQYRQQMRMLNVLPPSIEPTASGHILEQQDLVERILGKGYAYEVGGSVYFDVEKYSRDHHYGKLSGRRIEDLLSNTRELEKQEEKKSPLDFAIWKNADPEHLMRWPSRWGEGFPGWHVECSVMSSKYLGEEFDIHGGGMDLLFPHHECEIAQTVIGYGKESVRYWMHNNMITLNGQKMSKSLGNTINIEQFFTGRHELLKQAYEPMTIRFFMLQAHYRSTLDFSNDALIASEKGLERLFEGMANLEKLPADEKSDREISGLSKLKESFFSAMDDDFNTSIAISHLFEGVKTINSALAGKEVFSSAELEAWKTFYRNAVNDILGLQVPVSPSGDAFLNDELINLLLQLRTEARKKKDFEVSDRIRDEMARLGIEVKDTKNGFEWKLEK